MKKFIPIIFASLITLILTSCGVTKQMFKRDFNRFYDTYKDDSKVFSMSLPMFFTKLLVEKNDPGTNAALKRVKSLKLFVSKNKNNYYSRKMESYLPYDIYQDLMQVKKDSGVLKFKIRKSNKGEIEEIILIVMSHEGLAALALKGNITVAEVRNIIRAMKIEGMQDINRLGFKFLDVKHINVLKKNQKEKKKEVKSEDSETTVIERTYKKTIIKN